MEKLRLNKNERDSLLKFIEDSLTKCRKLNSLKIETGAFTKIKDNEVIKPKILIPAHVYLHMTELVRQSSIEIQWHGLVKRDIESNTYIIYDILMFPQTNTGTATTTNDEEFAKWQMNLLSDKNFPIEDLRFHGHSHVNMNVFSSGTDDQYQSDVLSKVKDGDYYIFFIMNKKQEIFMLLYDYVQQVMFETSDITLNIIDDMNKDIKTIVANEIKANCKTKTYGRNFDYYGGYYNSGSTLKIDEINYKKKGVKKKNGLK